MLGTIEQEAAACRKRFEGIEFSALVRCLHHEILCEALTEPIETRIDYILTEKPRHECARRLYEMRPILDDGSDEWAAYAKAWAAYDKARAAYDKALAIYLSTHRQQIIDMVPDTSWDGERLIFGPGKEK